MTARDRWSVWSSIFVIGIQVCLFLLIGGMIWKSKIYPDSDGDWLIGWERDPPFRYNAIVLVALNVMNFGFDAAYADDAILAALNEMVRQILRFECAFRLSLHVEYHFEVVREINPTIGFGRGRSTGHCWFHSRLYLEPRRWHRIRGNCRRSLTVVGISSIDDGCWGWLVDGWFRSV